MSTKMKGLIKGLRYISQIFDEEKDQEMEIGFPTDVKHVAHIGWDGPSVDSPSWMKEFKPPTSFQSAPLGVPGGDSKENPEIKWVSEDGKSARGKNSSAKDQPDAPKSSSRRQSENSSDQSPKKERTRHPRKSQSKDSSDSVKSNRQPQDPSLGSESPSRNLPDLPKKTRRKKSKDSVNGGSSGSVRSRMKNCDTSGTCPADAGADSGSVKSKKKDELSESSSLKPDIEEEEKEIIGIF